VSLRQVWAVGWLVVLVTALVVIGALLWLQGKRRVRPSDLPRPAPRIQTSAERFPRSRLLELATLAIGGLVAMTVALPVAALAVLPGLLGQRRRDVDLGPVSAFPEGQFVVTTFLSDPRAGEISRRTAYIRNNGLLGNLPSFTIMSSRCTHVGCPTQPNGVLFLSRRKLEHQGGGEVSLIPTQPSGFGCPCHGSQFDIEGNRTAGPAPRALDRYQFSIRNGRLILGSLYSVSHVDGAGASAQIYSFRLEGAGEPVSGVESLLYPVVPGS
jgi:Rieske Fe-S protein